MPRRKKQQQEVEGGIAPLVAARYAAQAAELIYDLLPENAKNWVDENLGVNWAKKNIIGPVAEAASEVLENIKNPNLAQERAAEKYKEERDAEALKTIQSELAKGWIFTCNNPDAGPANCLTNRKFYQLTAPERKRFKGETAPIDDTWYFNYNPLTGEYFEKTRRLDDMEREFGDKVRFDKQQKKWVYTDKYQKELDRTQELENATTEEEKQAVQAKHAQEDAEEAARQKKAQEDEWARQAAATQQTLDTQDLELRKKWAKSRGMTLEQWDAQQKAYLDEEQTPEQEQETQETGAGWETSYGRKGFSAGFAGGARLFNSINKPVLNVNEQEYNRMRRLDALPRYAEEKENNVLLWDNAYNEPLPPNQQLNQKSARLKKREYIKNRARRNRENEDDWVF